MSNAFDYSTTPASNNSTPPDGAPEDMAPSGVNNTMRQMMANIAALNKVYTATGTGDAQVVTFDPAPAAWTTSTLFYFRPVAANTGSATISNGVSAKTLKLPDASTDLPAGYLQTSNVYGVWYDGTNAVIVSRSRQFMGALVNKSAAQSIANNSAAVLTWNTEQFDEGGWHSTSSNTSRLTVPDGVRLVRVYANVRFDDNSTGYRQLQIIKNGSTFIGTPNARAMAITSATQPTLLSVNTGPVLVESGDYFEAEVFQNSGGALDLQNDNATWFSIEAIE